MTIQEKIQEIESHIGYNMMYLLEIQNKKYKEVDKMITSLVMKHDIPSGIANKLRKSNLICVKELNK